MTVGALLDLGADQAGLEAVLQSLPLEGYTTVVSRVKKAGLDACDFDVRLEEENHDHDMEYLHGHEHGHQHEDGHGLSHEHGHSHVRKGEHRHDPEPHSHAHRGLKEIREIINAGTMTEGARNLAFRIFEILAQAEAKAHGVSVEEVHFHEVGAVDSIVDVVAAAYCFDNLGIHEVIVSPLCEGQGTVRCQHGILPIPVPAVANIVSEWKLPLEVTETKGELVTPTGAAIAAAVRTAGRLPERFSIEKIGLGAGKREYERPGILRAMILNCDPTEDADEKRGSGISMDIRRQVDHHDADVIWKLETNIDDTTGENLGYVMDVLLQNGARDVFYTPIYMKKNRPAWLLSVICREEDISRMEGVIFRETTTIGIRRMKMERTVLAREEKTIQTPLGEVQVKACTYQGESYVYPEYESLVRLCREKGISFKEALRLVQACTQTVTD